MCCNVPISWHFFLVFPEALKIDTARGMGLEPGWKSKKKTSCKKLTGVKKNSGQVNKAQ